jgi:hypothetical protein
MEKRNIIIGDNIPSFHLIASKGKVLQRVSDGNIFGPEMYLGYTYYLNGGKLSEPLLELPEHFIEVDAPKEYVNEIDI